MKPITARLAGAGGVVALALGISMVSHQEHAHAQSPVCFTIFGGDCYCVDFFYTHIKEKVTSEAQQYINNIMGEVNLLRGVGFEEVIGEAVGHARTYGDYLDGEAREALNEELSIRDVPTGPNIPASVRATLERDPTGETAIGRQARAVATMHNDPESLAPYTVSRASTGTNTNSAEDIQEWTDRLVLEPAALEIPSNTALSEMPMSELLALYDSARNKLGAEYSRHYLKELAASESRLKALEDSRSVLDTNVDQSGAIHAASLQIQMVNLAIESELLESQLRRESLAAAIIAMRIGGAYEEE